MNRPHLLLPLSLFAILLLAVPPAPAADSDADWQAVVALDAGPQTPITSREVARSTGLAFLAKQESALRSFLNSHPSDVHTVDAQLRLAHVLSTRSDLAGDDAAYQAALQLLDSALKTAPEARRADFVFAKISLAMRRMANPTDADRDALTSRMNSFQKQFPNDRRLAALMAEVATLYDDLPKRKAALLQQAQRLANTEELRARIADDIKRLELLGQPVALRGPTVSGTDVDVAQFHGQVVLVYFFASWSGPSIAGVEEVNYLRKTFPQDQLAVIGVNLDSTRAAVDSLSKTEGIVWPILWDGRGWDGPLVRGLGINAVPTLWILDKKGNLRTLNARKDSEALVRLLLKEK